MARPTGRLTMEAELQKDAEEYLTKHKVDELLSGMMRELLTERPQDPLQYLIDTLTLSNKAEAKQDATGLSAYRRSKLERIFKKMDKNNSGSVNFRELEEHAAKYGQVLSTEELRGIFREFDTSKDNLVSKHEFFAFFAKVTGTCNNAEFDALVQQME
eukprot:jgi/Mesvir1/932/Mv17490-RA.1